MSKNVVPMSPAKVPARLANIFKIDTDDLSSGISSGFSIMSFRAGKWRIKHQGIETLVTNEEGEAKPSVEIVLLKGSKAISKIYYAASYADGSTAAPDCFATDGIAPDPGSPSPQSASCAVCPHNQWGSKITPAGKKSKACSDHRRVAITSSDDILNEKFGGSMLLRVPPASLTDLALYGKRMAERGFAYNTIVTRLGFDPDASYPKLTFKAVRPLTEDELEQVGELFTAGGEQMNRILSEANEFDVAPAAAKPVAALPEAVDTTFEMDAPPPVQKAPQKAPAAPKQAKAATPAPAPAKAASAPVEAEVIEQEMSPGDQQTADLDDILASLDSIG